MPPKDGDDQSVWDSIQSIPGDIKDTISGAVDTVGGAASFAGDPLGTIFQKVKEAAQGLSESVLPAVFEATQPDFSLDWFLNAYAVSYGIAVFLWAAILLWTIMQASRGVYSSEDVLDTLTVKAGLFFGLSTFGPAAGWLVLKLIGALSDSIAAWAVGGTAAEAVEDISDMVAATDVTGMVGGVVMALVMMAAMMLGLILVIVMLLVTMVTVYIAGAVAPLAFAWFANPSHQHLATRLLIVLGGVMAAKPLLFFVLGLAYRMAAGSVTWLEGPADLQGLANFGASVIAMAAAGLTPFLLFRFAPVMPTSAGQVGPSLGGGGGGSMGGASGAGSQTGARSSENAQRGEDNDAVAAETGGGPAGDDAPGTGTGGGKAGVDGTPEDSSGAIQQALKTKKDAAEGGEVGELASGQGGQDGQGSEGGLVSVGAEPDNDSPVTSAAGEKVGVSAPAAESTGASSTAAAGGGSGAGAGGAGAGGGAAGAAGVAYLAAQKSAELGASASEIAAAEMNGGDG